MLSRGPVPAMLQLLVSAPMPNDASADGS